MVQTNRIYLKMKYFDQCNACLLIKSINFFEKKNFKTLGHEFRSLLWEKHKILVPCCILDYFI